MLSGLEARGRAIAAAARARAVTLAAVRVREAVPDIAVSESEAGIVLSGRGLARRWLADARLRWIGSLLR